MTETYINSEGHRLWTATEGKGLPVVLCNGGPGCGDYLLPIAQLLKDHAQVIRFEHRGCGRSASSDQYSVATSLADLEAVRQHYNIHQWVIMGHSWGADLTLFYALEHPEHCLALACLSGGRMNNDREWHRVYAEKRDAGLENAIEFDFPPNMDVNQQVNASTKKYIRDPRLFKRISDLNLPALFLYGSQDIRPSWPVEQVAHLLPQAQFILLEGSDHHPWLSHAQELEQYLQSFVSSVNL